MTDKPILQASKLRDDGTESFPFCVETVGRIPGKFKITTVTPFQQGDVFRNIAAEWCVRNCAHDYHIDDFKYVHFEHEEDAILFRMVFS